jgi:hypothetical protein
METPGEKMPTTAHFGVMWLHVAGEWCHGHTPLKWGLYLCVTPLAARKVKLQ